MKCLNFELITFSIIDRYSINPLCSWIVPKRIFKVVPSNTLNTIFKSSMLYLLMFLIDAVAARCISENGFFLKVVNKLFWFRIFPPDVNQNVLMMKPDFLHFNVYFLSLWCLRYNRFLVDLSIFSTSLEHYWINTVTENDFFLFKKHKTFFFSLNSYCMRHTSVHHFMMIFA